MPRRPPILLLLLAACSASPERDPHFDADRSLVEVIAELEFGKRADLYRFDAPRDVTGENLFRATLARLANAEALLPDPRYRDSIQFARAQACERLFDFAAAVAAFEAVAPGGPLGETAQRELPLAKRLRDLTAPLPDDLPLDDLLPLIEQRRAYLARLFDESKPDAADGGGDPRVAAARRSLIERAIERLDVRRREFLWRVRAVLPGGTERAIDAAARLVEDHRASARVHQHELRLADMYAELARGYVAAVDPDGFEFDAARFRGLAQAAARIYAGVATLDGRPEREEARAALAELDALLARVQGPRP